MKRSCAILVLAAEIAVYSAGCARATTGPVYWYPSAEQQKNMDRAWDSLGANVGSLDRTTLLDCLVVCPLHVFCADEVRTTSKKKLADGGIAIVDFTFFREAPTESRLTFTLLDPSGVTARIEVYTIPEVDERDEFLTNLVSDEDLAKLPEPERSQRRAKRAAGEERMAYLQQVLGY